MKIKCLFGFHRYGLWFVVREYPGACWSRCGRCNKFRFEARENVDQNMIMDTVLKFEE